MCSFLPDEDGQFQFVNAEQIKAWVDGKRKFVLIDARMPEEYGESHIPCAINIPVEQMIFQGGMPEWTSKGFPVKKGFWPYGLTVVPVQVKD